MKVVSLKDYAAEKGISYEAVRQQVVRYKDELSSHVIKDGRQQFLDEEAVAFLDAKRQKNPVAIIQQDKNERIEELEEQVKQLLIKIAAQADKISEMAQWRADHALAIAEADQTKLLLDDTRAQLIKIESEMAERVEMARQEAAEAAKADAAEEMSNAVTKVRMEAQKAAADAEHLHQQELAARDEKIRELQNRSRWQRFLDVFK